MSKSNVVRAPTLIQKIEEDSIESSYDENENYTPRITQNSKRFKTIQRKNIFNNRESLPNRPKEKSNL